MAKISNYIPRRVLVFFFFFLANFDVLFDIVIRCQSQRTDVQLYVLSVQEIFGQSTNFFRPSGGPHQHLSVGLNENFVLKNKRRPVERRE